MIIDSLDMLGLLMYIETIKIKKLLSKQCYIIICIFFN